MEVNTLQIEYRFENKEIILDKAKDLAKELYNIILKIQDKIKQKYKNLNQALPKLITLKELSKINGSKHPEEAKASLVNEKSAFLMLET